MAILNVTPDSFSDGREIASVDSALKRVEQMVEEGADIIDIGGESTRPGSQQVTVEQEISRVIPIIEAIKIRFDLPLSIDTSKSKVAEAAVESGAEIINDISGLTFDNQIAGIAKRHNAGLVLMHLRGNFEEMHYQKPVDNIVDEVSDGLRRSIKTALDFGVGESQICLDIGIGFSKTFEQNLELIAKLNRICQEFAGFPILFGASRKSFIGKILGNGDTSQRLNGTIASNVLACWNGANIVRVHNVKETVEALKVTDAVKREL